jgi:hypothetical protein
MADPLSASVFEIRVRNATAPETFVPIADVTSYDHGTTRTTTRTRVFGRATPYASTSLPEGTYSITALLNPTDPGQIELFEAEDENRVTVLEVFPEGGTTNGFKQEVKVSSKRHGARADGDFQEVTFEFTPNADPAVIGTGIVI